MSDKQSDHPSLEDQCRALHEAGHDLFKARRKEGLGGAVCWVEYGDGTVVIFTRGEYRETLMRNIDEIPEPKTVVFKIEGDEEDILPNALGFASTDES